jgi:hypothetical protein
MAGGARHYWRSNTLGELTMTLEEVTLDGTDRFAVDGYRGIAWYVIGAETEPNADTEWTGIENENGNVVCVMVGDDRKFSFEPDELTLLEDDAYCPECGQIGCGHGR